jgi:UDP-GlcNAc:undecaprenyl-phosphate/decaprenyl-phosphate GlcNAc-1-phosphate transferase
MIVDATLAFLLTALLTPLVIAGLHRFRVIDVPTERSSHSGPVPRGGGLAVAVGAVAGLLLSGSDDASSLSTLLVAVSILAVVGMVDDLRTLEVVPRLSAQLLGAILCLPWLLNNLSMPWEWRVLLAVGAVIWVMGFVNAFNFMDGINGISSFATIVAGVTFFVAGQVRDAPLLSVCGLVVAAAALGFLPYNFPQARVFLGDVGSYFLGGWIAFTVLLGLLSEVPPEAVIGPTVIYLADTSFTLARRVKRRERWWTSHHEHVYQQLIDRQWSHARSALLVTGFTVTCSALGLLSLASSTTLRVVADVGIVACAALYLSVPSLLALWRSSKAPASPPQLSTPGGAEPRPAGP